MKESKRIERLFAVCNFHLQISLPRTITERLEPKLFDTIKGLFLGELSILILLNILLSDLTLKVLEGYRIGGKLFHSIKSESDPDEITPLKKFLFQYYHSLNMK